MRTWTSSQPPLGVPFTVNRASPQARGLVAWWPTLGAVGSTVIRDPIHGLDMTMGGTNNPTWTVQPGQGQVLGFDGTSRYARTVYAADLNVSAITLTAWIRSTNTGTQNILDRDAFSAGNRVFQLRLAPQLQFIPFFSGSPGILTGTTSLANDSLWHHVAATYDGASIRLYVEGKEENSPPETRGFDSATSRRL